MVMNLVKTPQEAKSQVYVRPILLKNDMAYNTLSTTFCNITLFDVAEQLFGRTYVCWYNIMQS